MLIIFNNLSNITRINLFRIISIKWRKSHSRTSYSGRVGLSLYLNNPQGDLPHERKHSTGLRNTLEQNFRGKSSVRAELVEDLIMGENLFYNTGIHVYDKIK